VLKKDTELGSGGADGGVIFDLPTFPLHVCLNNVFTRAKKKKKKKKKEGPHKEPVNKRGTPRPEENQTGERCYK
jgi:hypothetical protein